MTEHVQPSPSTFTFVSTTFTMFCLSSSWTPDMDSSLGQRSSHFFFLFFSHRLWLSLLLRSSSLSSPHCS
jgi:hypothetical protein